MIEQLQARNLYMVVGVLLTVIVAFAMGAQSVRISNVEKRETERAAAHKKVVEDVGVVLKRQRRELDGLKSEMAKIRSGM